MRGRGTRDEGRDDDNEKQGMGGRREEGRMRRKKKRMEGKVEREVEVN